MALMNYFIYEHPLNERVRLFLRLEHVLQQLRKFNCAEDIYSMQLFFDALFDALNYLHRYELRGEMIKELNSYKNYFSEQNSHDFSAEIDEALKCCHQLNINEISALRDNELFNSLRQRNFNQSGNCAFEVPAYQYWLHHIGAEEKHFFIECSELFLPIEKTINLILTLVRKTGEKSEESASEGIYLKTIDWQKRGQMIRIYLDSETKVFPRISGDKHRVAIRFMIQESMSTRAIQAKNMNIAFNLQICSI